MAVANAAGLWLTDLTNAQALIDAGIASAIPLTTRGDLVTRDASTTVRLPIGAANRVLRSNGTDPSWAQVALATDVTGALPIANGGTGQATQTAGFDALSPVTTRGDIIVRGASNNVRLAVGAANRVLRSDGTDPAWGQVALTTDVTGTLPFANGGNGLFNQTTTAVAVNNTTSETTVYTVNIVGGSLSTNKKLVYEGVFKATSVATPPQIVIKVKYGATVITFPTLQLAVNLTDVPFILRVSVSALDATNAQAIIAELVEAGIVTAATTKQILAGGPAAEDSTADKTFIVTIQPDAAIADTTVTMQKSSLYLVQ